MKSILALILMLLPFFGARLAAQSDTTAIFFDSSMHVTTRQNAVYVQAVAHHDKLYFTVLVDIKNQWPLYTGSYRDKKLTVQEGVFSYFTNNMETMRGSYHNGRQVGVWQKWGQDSLVADSVLFDNDGNMEFEAKYTYHTNKKPWRYTLENGDNEKVSKEFDTSGALVSEGKFTGGDGETFIYYPGGKIKIHSVFRDNVRTSFEFFDEDGKKYTAAQYEDYIKTHQK